MKLIKQYFVQYKIPGISKENLTITVDGNLLKIEGNSNEFKDGDHIYKHSRKISYTSTLPKNVNQNEMSAELKDGILTINLPKLEQGSNIKKIAIN